MYREIYETLEIQGKVKSAVLLDGPCKGSRCMVKDGKCVGLTGDADWTPFEKEIMEAEETGVRKVGETRVFVEVYLKNPHLVIFGGGHVSRPCAHLGKMLGFHVTVMDDREEFVTKERFPEADERITGSYQDLDQVIPQYENAYYVIVTRGHEGDTACARQILRRPYSYLGMIGSKNKVRVTRERLLGEGFSQEQLDTLHAPIGLPIGGKMPEEIAVSIMAQIVQVKNRYAGVYCDQKVEEALLRGREGVMMTIVSQSGSSPRGMGSKMFVEAPDKTAGSIGGGSVEFRAVKHCAQVSGTEMRLYDLEPNGSGEKTGMICGGRVEVLFEKTGK